uniref:RING-type domain-containing protein n=1 Tax=Astatotilapia calliptera TaxID=8154 RepID=A0A3P8P8P8_ASTCA
LLPLRKAQAVDPIFLSCSHSFCKMCLKDWWAQKLEQQCPVCKNISEQMESEVLCSLHFEKLKLFCLDHQEPACVICRDSRAHVDHKFKPIDEAVQDHKKVLQKSLEPLQDKLKVLQKVQENFDITQQRIKFQDQHTEKQIKEQFKKFHQFLHEEEKVRLTALKKEEQEKSQKMKEKTAALSREMPSLLQTIGAAEEVLRAEDVSFLQNYSATLKSVEQYSSTDDPPLVSELKGLPPTLLILFWEQQVSLRCESKVL